MILRRSIVCVAAMGVLGLLAGCQGGGGNDLPPIKPIADPPPARGESFLGLLRGGVSAIGGETTGWVLRLDEPVSIGVGPVVSSLEINADRVLESAKAFDGRRVRITGTLVDKKYVERGVVRVLVAGEIRLVE